MATLVKKRWKPCEIEQANLDFYMIRHLLERVQRQVADKYPPSYPVNGSITSTLTRVEVLHGKILAEPVDMDGEIEESEGYILK